jgi:PAS domain S-box-containing protein
VEKVSIVGYTMRRDEYISTYEKILDGYLRTGQEVFLLQSYDLGKKMMQNDLSTEFAADMHFRSLEKVRRKIISEEFRERGYNPGIPFLELTMAFGFAFHSQLGALLRFTEIVEAGKREWEKTIDAIDDAISLHDSDGLVIRANKAFCDLLGKTFQEVIGKSPWSLFEDRESPSDGCRLTECLSRLRNGADMQPVSYETYIPKLKRYFLVSVIPVRDGTMMPLFVIHTMKDITQKKKRENDEKAFQQKIRNEIALAEERERRRIAQDIHDNLGQTLAIAKRKIQEVHANLTTTTDSGKSVTDIKEIAHMLDQMIGQTRTLTFDLYPPMLDDLGLIQTIEWYAENFASKTGLKINVIKTGKPGTLTSLACVYLFRAVKEILNNVLKHAGAQEVMLAMHGSESRLRIVVDDDGRGFDVDSMHKMSMGTSGIGFVNIRQWISDMEGSFFVESTPGHGTRVVIEAPVQTDRI